MHSPLSLSAPPAHGGQLRAISQAFAVPVDQLLDFSASIYPNGPPEAVFKALSNALRSPHLISEYPDLESDELREQLGRYAGVPAANILVSNGIVPLLSATIRALKIRRCLLPIPAFGQYRRVLECAGSDVLEYQLMPERSFRPGLEEMLACCVRHGCDAVILNNPHNPSGAALGLHGLRHLVYSAAQHRIRILLDEAFIDFVPQLSICGDVPRAENLVVFRSVTKFFAMAGLRVAYLVSPVQMAGSVARMLDPWSISSLASIAAMAAIQDSGYIRGTLNRNAEERAWLTDALRAIGLTVSPSRTNFLLFQLSPVHRDGSVWERLIVDQGLVLRNCATFDGLDGSYLRLAVRGREDNQRLVRAMISVLNLTV